MTTSVLFKITEAGQTALVAAHAAGSSLTLLSFKLGSSVAYEPDGSETSLYGTVLYSSAISNYENLPDGSLRVFCTIDAAAGPFTFGEVGIYTTTGLLFGLFALPIAQTKDPFDEQTNRAGTFTFRFTIRIPFASQTLRVTGATLPPQEYVSDWSEVLNPSLMLDISIKQLVVSSEDIQGDYSALIQKTNGWSLQGNMYAFGYTPKIKGMSVDKKTLKISGADWQKLVEGDIARSVTTASSYRIVIEAPYNAFRSATVSVNGTDVDILLKSAFAASVVVNSLVKVWIEDSSLLKVSEDVGLQLAINSLSATTASSDVSMQTSLNALSTHINSTDTGLQGQLNALAITVANLSLNTLHSIPSGLIVDWRSTVIPAGWVICDGTNGTPNLRNRFVLGAGAAYLLDQSGGSKDAILPSHSHPLSSLTGTASSEGSHVHTYKTYGLGNNGLLGNAHTNYDWGYAQTGNPPNTAEGDHSHSLNITGTIGTAGTSTGVGLNLPPYYALIQIMKL